MLRSFIEALAVAYLKKHNDSVLQHESKLHKKLDCVYKDLIARKVAREQSLQTLAVATSDKNSMLSPIILGGMVHLTTVPTKRELIQLWDTWQPILLLMNKESL